MKPNFEEMTRKELREYVLAHRDDNEAFYAYMDKLHADKTRVKFPPLKSIDDMNNYPEFLEVLRKAGEKNRPS